MEEIRIKKEPEISNKLAVALVSRVIEKGKISGNGEHIEYSNFGGCSIIDFKSGNFIDSAYKMLCWCIKKGHVTKDENI